MIKKIYLLSIFFLMFFSVLNAQRTLELFKIYTVNLNKIERDWGEELFLEIEGEAHPVIGEGILTATIFYMGKRASWVSIYLPAKKKDEFWIKFKGKWGPLNKATQEILSGRYQVSIELYENRQRQKIKERLLKIKERNIKYLTIQKIAKNLGSEQEIKKENDANRNFFISSIKNLNLLFRELDKKRNTILRLYYDLRRGKKNFFIVDGKFSYRKWLSWADNFSKEVKKEKILLEKHLKQVYFPQYPQTRINMERYCEILLNMESLYTKTVYKFHKKNIKGEMVPFKIKTPINTIYYIQDLHAAASSEMQIDFYEVLGFLPPPGY